MHGSHLYGLAHSGSDDDFYAVVNTRRNRRSKWAKQSIVEGVDTTTVDLGTWVNMCQNGVPQALEAVFAGKEFVHYESSGIREFRASFVMGESARDRYTRTIKNFLEDDSVKKKRHAVRLALNLRDGLRYGRFNPTLTPRLAIWVTYQAKTKTVEELHELTENLTNP